MKLTRVSEQLLVQAACPPLLGAASGPSRLRVSVSTAEVVGLAVAPARQSLQVWPSVVEGLITDEGHIQICDQGSVDRRTLLVNHGLPSSSSVRSHPSNLCLELLRNLVRVGGAMGAMVR